MIRLVRGVNSTAPLRLFWRCLCRCLSWKCHTARRSCQLPEEPPTSAEAEQDKCPLAVPGIRTIWVSHTLKKWAKWNMNGKAQRSSPSSQFKLPGSVHSWHLSSDTSLTLLCQVCPFPFVQVFWTFLSFQLSPFSFSTFSSAISSLTLLPSLSHHVN